MRRRQRGGHRGGVVLGCWGEGVGRGFVWTADENGTRR